MKPLRNRLQEARKRLGVPWEVLERDYLLSWVLAGMSRVDSLQETFVFKGGTALKKCYFGDYRFSEDLDFSGVDAVPKGDAMEKAVKAACLEAARMLDEFAPVEIICERYTEREPHPQGQEAFVIRSRFPWHREPQTRVMVETTVDEQILKPVNEREVIHEYGETFEAKVKVYSLEEVVAEKLRGILQHMDRLKQRGWSRSRARDYYDLWRIFGAYRDELDLTDFRSFLQEKCRPKGVSFQDADSFFQEAMVGHVEKTWEQWLGPLVPDLPPFERVRDELRPQVDEILGL